MRADLEREILRDFRLRATAYINLLPSHDLELLFIMQHYGLPTRLLDWTESHLFALYFAVRNIEASHDAAVWVLDPWSLNEAVIQQKSVPTVHHPDLSEYVLDSDPEQFERQVKAKAPVAVRPPHGTERIVAQRGMFTLHGYDPEDLDTFVKQTALTKKKQIGLEKISIDGSKKTTLMKELYMAGISHSTVFPEIEGLAKEIGFRYSREYMSQAVNDAPYDRRNPL
jgi:hypothetical protein